MADDIHSPEAILRGIRRRLRSGALRFSAHATVEMDDEAITAAEVSQCIRSKSAAILENYPTHLRGACCLLAGETARGRWLHVVCTSASQGLIIITVYEPKPPKWVTPSQRGK